MRLRNASPLIETLLKKFIKFIIFLKPSLVNNKFHIYSEKNVYCKRCQKELDAKDFYHPEICYKCDYKVKIKILKKSKKKQLCKICNKDIPEDKKKYCSQHCADKGKDMHNRSYWIHNFNAPKIKWNQ